MDYDVRTVVFDMTVPLGVDGQFAIPDSVCEILGLHTGDNLALSIETPSGTYTSIRKLATGTDISGSDLRDYVKSGERIKVTASRT